MTKRMTLRTKMGCLIALILIYAAITAISTSMALKQMVNCVSQEEAMQMSAMLTRNIMGISAICLLIVVGLVVIITVDIFSGLKKATAYAGQIAEGDLSEEISPALVVRKDSIGDVCRCLDQIQGNLSTLLGAIQTEIISLEDVVKQAEMEVDGISQEIEGVSATTQQLAAGTQETAASSQEISTTAAEIESVAKNIATHAEDGVARVLEIHERASQTKEKTQANRRHVNQVNKEIKESLTKALQDAEVVSQIEVLAEAIMQITSQTNLLSLNASIEAARAGEAGKGFAVVADEIRNLAEQSESTVTHIQEVTERVTKAMKNLADDASRLLEFVGTDVSQSFDFFDEMADSYNGDAEYVDGLITDFSATSEELLASIDNVLDAINGVSEASSEGADGTTEIANKVQIVADRSINIVDVVRKAGYSSETLGDHITKFKMKA